MLLVLDGVHQIQRYPLHNIQSPQVGCGIRHPEQGTVLLTWPNFCFVQGKDAPFAEGIPHLAQGKDSKRNLASDSIVVVVKT